MALLKLSSSDFSARRAGTRHLIEQASVALLYVGIVTTFAAFSLIAFAVWLLIW